MSGYDGVRSSMVTAVFRLRKLFFFMALCSAGSLLWPPRKPQQYNRHFSSPYSVADNANWSEQSGSATNGLGLYGSPPHIANDRAHGDPAQQGKGGVGNTSGKAKFSGFMMLGDEDMGGAAAQRRDLRRCFSSLYASRGNHSRWQARRGKANITCGIERIGAFRITNCLRDDVCAVESLDEDDYGEPYFMKLGRPNVLRQEADVVRHLSNSNRSRGLTAKPHPRYPYLQWKMTDHKHSNVTAIITEQLISGASKTCLLSVTRWTRFCRRTPCCVGKT